MERRRTLLDRRNSPDRRIFPRVEAIFPIQLRAKEVASARRSKIQGEIINISRGGASLNLGAYLPIHSLITLRIDPSPLYSQIEMGAQVIWSNRLGKGDKSQCGVVFLKPKPEQLSVITKLLQRLEKKTFVFERTVYLTDTNAEGNTYFTKYFEWQGMAREEFVRANVPGLTAILQSGIRIITVEAYLHFIHETVLFDEVLINVNTSNIKKTSLDLIFTYTNKKTNQLIAEGRQKLAFVDSTGKLIPIPEEIREKAMYFLVEAGTSRGAKK